MCIYIYIYIYMYTMLIYVYIYIYNSRAGMSVTISRNLCLILTWIHGASLRSVFRISCLFLRPRLWQCDIWDSTDTKATYLFLGFEMLNLKFCDLKLWQLTVLVHVCCLLINKYSCAYISPFNSICCVFVIRPRLHASIEIMKTDRMSRCRAAAARRRIPWELYILPLYIYIYIYILYTVVYIPILLYIYIYIHI